MEKNPVILKERAKLLLLALLFISLNSFSANTKFYNISDIYGITSGEAFSICKDQYGFIWTSTKTGVLRVTEGDCRNYELPCKTTDFVFVKLAYGNSQLFSYTNNGQIFHYNELTDQFCFLIDLREETGNNHITIGTIVADTDSTLWIASSTGLFKYGGSILTKITQPEEDTKYLTFYDSNRLFYATPAGISLLNTSTLKSKTLFSNDRKEPFQVSSLYYDDRLKRLWIGTESAGLFYYDIIRNSLSDIPIKGFPKQPVLAIRKDTNNSLLVGIDGQGIWNISEKGDTILHIYKEDLNNPHSLRGDGVYDIFCDASRNWVATYTGKLSFFENNYSPVTPITYQINNPNSLGNNHVNKIVEDREGHIWFATNNGLSRWDATSGRWTHYYQDKSEQAKVFLALCEDNQGHIWAGSYSSGIYLLDRKTGKTLKHYSSKTGTPGFAGDFIFDFFVDKEGDVWISGNQKLSCYLAKEDRFREYPVQPVSSAFAELAPGKLLLTTSYGLLLLDKKQGTVETLVEGSLTQDVVVTGNTVWVATCRDGLIKYDYDKRQAERFTTESGLTSNYVNSILFDNCFLWIGTEQGMCRLNILNNAIQSYTSVYSLSNTTFRVNSCTRLKNGKLIWGTNNGAIMFTPEQIRPARPQGHIFFQNITVAGRSIRTIPSLLNNTPVNQQKNLVFNYTQNNFILELLPIGSSSGNMKFSWLLEGLDTSWSTPSELHFINYTNLPGGNFKLHIRMYDSSLSQIVDERSLSIRVTPPFWKTWWFATIIGLFITGYIIYAFRSYSNRLKRKNTNDRLIADAAQALMQEKTAQAETGREEKPVLPSKPGDPFVSRAITVINENISNSEFGKEEFAAAMNVSSSLLYKKIKTLTAQSPSDFIKTVRMNHALKLLQSGQYTVTEVSELSGFSSLSIFSRAFKSYFGKTPTEI